MTDQDEARLTEIEGMLGCYDTLRSEDIHWLVDRLNTTLAKLTLAEGAQKMLEATIRSDPCPNCDTQLTQRHCCCCEGCECREDAKAEIAQEMLTTLLGDEHETARWLLMGKLDELGVTTT